jgi:hypothetical protein
MSTTKVTGEMTGGCLCGAVRYRAAGTPDFQGLCHCRDCQRLSGGGHVGFMCFPTGRVTIEGQTLAHKGVGGSGQPADRHYCPQCLSQLFGFTDVLPGKTNIYAGSLDDNSQFEPTFAIFVRSRPPWDRSSQSLQCFETLPEALPAP